MKYLLFEGAAGVGKTSAINRFRNTLKKKYGYAEVIFNQGFNNDFMAVFENKNVACQRIVVNSASDYLHVLDEFKTFADSNAPYDLVISSCREEESLYSYFLKNFI